MMLPVGAAFGTLATALSSSLLDSSLLEVCVLAFAFLADGPFVAPVLLGGAFRFLASGDLGKGSGIKMGESTLKWLLFLIC